MNVLWLAGLLVSLVSRRSNASITNITNSTQDLDILVADIPFPAEPTEKSGIGYIVCNKTKVNGSNPEYYNHLKSKSKTDKCDILLDLSNLFKRHLSNLHSSFEHQFCLIIYDKSLSLLN